VRAFPALFPSGRCDLHDPSRPFKISHDQNFKHLMKYEDGRFAKDHRFRFFCLNSKLRWEAIKTGNLFVRRRGLASMTCHAGECELRGLLTQRPTLANEIAFFATPLRVARSFWYKRCSELKDMVRSIGAQRFSLRSVLPTSTGPNFTSCWLLEKI
jgi:hypothetical protein